MRETGRSGVAAYLSKRITALGGYRRKVCFEGHRGAPDQLCFIPKHRYLKKPFWVETKAPLGVLKPHQEREHKRLRAMGFQVFVPYTTAQVDELLETGKITT